MLPASVDTEDFYTFCSTVSICNITCSSFVSVEWDGSTDLVQASTSCQIIVIDVGHKVKQGSTIKFAGRTVNIE